MPPVLVREFENWKVLKASETDTKCYYFNTKTKEVTWLVPAGLNEIQAPPPPPALDVDWQSRSLSLSTTSTGSEPTTFGTVLPIDKVMNDDKCDREELEYEISRSENDRPRQLSIHGPNTINSPQMPQPLPPPSAVLEEPVVPERPPPLAPVKPGWKPVVGQPCGALWIDGHFWKATVVAEDTGGLRYKVMYDVDGSEALVAREALRPPKIEVKVVETPIRPSVSTPAMMARPTQNPDMPRSASSMSSPWSNRDASNARSEMMVRQNTLVQQFNTEFPNLRLPSLEDFYRPQYAAALHRFGQQDFELLCDAQKSKGFGILGKILK